MQILHVSEVEVRETKMMGSSPVIIVMVCKLLLPKVYYQFINLFLCSRNESLSWGFCSMYFQFQTQQIYCVRDRNGSITEGGKVNDVFLTTCI